MSVTYTITTNFGNKDSLPSGDSDKVIRGTEFTTEFNSIQTAFGLCAPSASPTFTGTAAFSAITSSSDLTVGGDIDVTGTVDGRDVATDGTKLDTIAANANAYTHPSHPGDDITLDTGPLTGATVISNLDFNVTTDTLGHVTDANATVSTRNMTAADVSALANTGGTVTGNVTINGVLSVTEAIDLADNDILRFGTGDDCELFTDGTDMYMDLNAGINNFVIRDGATTRFTFDDAGDFTATGDITAFSDARIKDEIKPIESALDKVDALMGCTYVRTDIGDGKRKAGLIAQDVQAVLPEAVHEQEDGTLALNYNGVIALLVEAIKELR